MSMSVITLGTAGGPPPVAGRQGIATALTVGDAVYLIDCGRGAVTQYVNCGYSASPVGSARSVAFPSEPAGLASPVSPVRAKSSSRVPIQVMYVAPTTRTTA